jgi:zinc D-Ala-D-Ala carboxypeptidase
VRIALPRRSLGALLAAATVLTPTAAQAAGPGPTAPQSTTAAQQTSAASPATPDPRIEQEPTAEEIQQQLARVARLRRQVEERAADRADARAALDATAELASSALESSATAVRQLLISQQAEQQRTEQLRAARSQVAEQRHQLGEWARQAYQRGGQLTADPTMTVLLSADDNQDVTTGLNVIKRLGEEHNANLRAVVVAQQRADQAADRAAAATQRAESAAVEATNTRREADAAVAQQRKLLGQADSALGDSRTELSAAEQHQRDLQLAAAQAEAATQATRRNGVTGAVGDCTGGDIEQYANGMIPVSALCALQSDGRHHLRADAAFAFDRLAGAYAQQFGGPPCITDSYRSYAQQVDVYARKPGLAARPGTSNHGWGTALDLCGGIQNFTSAQHRWMKLNAPLFGWFHPAWAEPGGSRPEPWHWEYAS